MLGLGLNIFTLAIRRYFGGGGSSLNLDFTSGNQSLDPRITFTRASTGTRVNASGVIESVAIDGPRFDYDPATLAPKGLLIEEQRTNSIRNNTMVGAVAGTPGTAPTDWTIFGNTGVSTSVIGVGTENGISYVDVRFQGASPSAVDSSITPVTTTLVAAASGQTWTISSFVRIASGSVANIASVRMQIDERNISGGFVNADSTSFTPATIGLGADRRTHTRLLTGATTAFVRGQIIVGAAGTGPIDITLRIGLPQLEQGAFATSAIPTTTAAATRAADVAVMTGANFSNWYRQDEGTLFGETQLASAAARNAAGFDVNDGGTNNRIIFRALTTGGADQVVVRSGGATAATLASASSPTVAVRKSAIAYKLDDFAFTAAGLTPIADTLGAVPVSANQMLIGFAAGPGEYLGGHLRRISYFPRRLTNSELQGITS